MADSSAVMAELAKKEVEFQKAKTTIHREILNTMDLGRISDMNDDRLITHIQRIAQKVLNARKQEFKDIDTERLVAELVAESFGLGPLEVFMKDPEITDILVNGPEEVYIEKRGVLSPSSVKFADATHLMQIIQRIVAKVGRRVDEQTPMVDARLADGSRVNAIIKPLAINGPILSIRRFGNTPLAIEDLIAFGSVPQPIVQLLKAAVEGKINIMISGGTGSGKTTLLNCISKFIPAGERLVTVEDSAELKLQRPHVVSLESRNANSEGKGEVTLRDLVRNSLRMRPDRIILGEVRGPEALDMLQAMNTGHEGSLTTIHANGIRDSLSRLEVMVSMTGLEIPVSVVRRYISSAITLVIQLARLRGGVRRVLSVSEITGFENDDYQINELFYYKQRGADMMGRAIGNFFATGNKPGFLERLNSQGIKLPEELFDARQF
ncbi:MAG: CpaF family protein [Thermoguttaceae bacterium]|nr:CpaF family protein [Thermoguttaceae bacterium]MBR0190966.1 CpaF family protein [Thermoguttaceae bacterium]